MDKEVDAVIAELTEGRLEGAIDAPTAVPEPVEQPEVPAVEAEEEKAEQEGLQAMQARLESL